MSEKYDEINSLNKIIEPHLNAIAEIVELSNLSFISFLVPNDKCIIRSVNAGIVHE